MPRQYHINGELWPQPDSSPWTDISNGAQLGTNLPVLSPYRQHVWNYPVLPDCDFSAMLETVRNTELVTLVTNPPGSAEDLVEYDDARVISITSTPSWGHPRSVTLTFEVYAP